MLKKGITKGVRKTVVLALLAILATIGAFLYYNSRQQVKDQLFGSEVPVADTARLWFRHAAIYTLDVKVFQDADGDGVGDFKGLIHRLDYLERLGINTLWLAPFQPSPGEDDGYDITDYYGIDPRLGTPEDFQALIAAAHRHHMRVLMDLVPNHTSSRHPWFLQARQSNASPYHSWYVWSKGRPANYHQGMVFPGVQQDIWTYDSTAGEYYYHRFYRFQPDLNMQQPAVWAEVKKVVRYWLDRGVSGFRLDAVPFMIEVPQQKGEDFPKQYALLQELRRYASSINPEAVILGEANVPPGETEHYFGRKGDAMNMMFNFCVNQHLFYALASGETAELEQALKATGHIPAQVQWGQFLRNHDEVDLGRLSGHDRNQVYQAFGPDSTMQLYHRGIRRRLAPMLHNPQQLRLAYSLLLSLPSTPVLRYGDELGMGDDLSLKERLSVRTPMQWTARGNAGFTTSVHPIRPVIAAGPYAFSQVNAAAEEADSASLLSWMKRMVRLRQSLPELSFGQWCILPSGSPHVLALRYQWQGRRLIVLHNFSAGVQEAQLPGSGASITDIITGRKLNINKIALPGYGYCWCRMPMQ